MLRVRAALALAAALMVVGTFGVGAHTAHAAPAPARFVTITIPPRAADLPHTWWNYDGPPRAMVMLPTGYDRHRQYPLLLALHGLESSYAWWAQAGLRNVFTGLDAIVVMPEGGSGWYTDWWNDGKRGGPSWETYDLDDVLPAILKRYPIRPERQYHAVVGVSMGGMGATYLGGRLPGFFGSVASISGFTDPGWFSFLTVPAMGLTSIAPLRGDLALSPVEGPANGFYMVGHDPTALASNLAHTRVFVATGTGAPSRSAPFNVPGSNAEGQIIYPMNRIYDGALQAADVDVTFRVQPGGHDNLDFADELRAMLAWGPFRSVDAAPRSWINHTVATHGQVWDVGYRFTRPPDRIVELRRSGDVLSIGPAGADVTLTTGHGCHFHLHTPARVRLPAGCA